MVKLVNIVNLHTIKYFLYEIKLESDNKLKYFFILVRYFKLQKYLWQILKSFLSYASIVIQILNIRYHEKNLYLH